MLSLRCSDAGFECNRVIRGETEDEIMKEVSEHASRDHGIRHEDMNQQMIEKIKNLIQTV